MKKIPLIKPYITEEVKAKVCEVLDSGYLTEGPVTRKLEEAVKDYVGCRYAIAATSCTTGLEIALRAIGVGAGDEVIVPDYTYPATASVVQIVGAKSVIIDVDPETMLINYNALEKAITKNTKAVIPVSMFGNPLDYDRLSSIKQKHDIYIIEDAACSLGAEFKNKMVGNWADISVFSFHPRKFITTGEGGMVTTDNASWADWMLSYKHFGMGVSETRLTTSFDRIGTNYKLSNVLAAIGLAQMQHIDTLLDRRRYLASKYIELLSCHTKIRLPEITPGGVHSYQSFCVFIENRDKVMQALRKQGIEVQIGTYALHNQKAFADNPNCRILGNMPGSNYSFEHCLTLPLYHELSQEDQVYIISKLQETVS